MRRLIALTLTATPACLMLATTAQAEVPAVVTDIPAVHSLAAQVMGELGQPAILLEQGGNAHSYQMKPSQARALQNADLIFWIGPEMTPWLDRAIEGVALSGKPVALLQAEGTFRREFGDGAEGHAHEGEGDDHPEHADDNAHDDHAHEGENHEGHDDHADEVPEDDHDHSGTDPHAWLDPANAQAWLGVIAAELAAADPENAATYSANADAASEAIAALDTQIAATLAPVQGRPFVVFHDAYGYFAGHYGLTIAGTVSLGDAAAPGAERLTEIRHLLEDEAAVCIFPEAQHDPKQIEALVEGTPVKLGAALDPSGSNLPFGPDLYPALLTTMAETLEGCLKD
ncbi:zinc ABC transporter substrate-binding protein [Frigidibacter sp.]|uniref:zinc ABC transporter substrate-binding protein n=1 Tax=Frigidibacter sp. TaxID=2586418 RepID=UPI002735D3C8|nr:zinc ABC transporter substrate-binding protein [Frigidibacter sp.]MDP3339005.1 zinc ABC transporter substrate-binding protein [Frigidibacter sp.]